jgi:hypothetical protein
MVAHFYPEEFCADAINDVEAVRLEAQIKLRQRRTEEPPDGWTIPAWDFGALNEYVLTVVLAFASGARKLGHKGTWAIDRIRLEIDRFELHFAKEAENEEGCDRR